MKNYPMASFLRGLHRVLFCVAILALICPSVHAFAASASATEKTPELSIRLLSSVKGTQKTDSGPILLGLEINLAPHWKTYWRTPGTVGFPARIKTDGSQNVKNISILWPLPARFNQSGLQALGYTDHVVLPLELELEQSSLPVSLKAKVSLMACSELCVPFDFSLSLDLPSEPALPTAYADLIEKARLQVPASEKKLPFSSLSLEKTGLKLVLTPEASVSPVRELFIESPSGAQFGAPVVDPSRPQEIFSPLLSVKSPPKAGSPLTLTFATDTKAYEVATHLPEALPSEAEPLKLATASSFFSVLIAAFMGGLILNLMPCVLPVLSLKIISVLGHAGAAPRQMRAHLLASASGIIVSFMGLAVVAQGLKSAGHVLGWGMQFQHAGFLIGMMVLLTFFAASLWGLLHIPLPRFLADAITDRLPGPGEQDRTLVGNFLTGVFATLLATPCSAPFVGTAIGFALAGRAIDLFATALLMGLGMASPFLLMALKPELGRFLPKPGRWMNGLKTLLGFALMATVFWLGTLLHKQLSPVMASFVGGLPLFMIVVLWIRASIKTPALLVKGFILMGLLLLGLWGLRVSGIQLLSSQEMTAKPSQTEARLDWKPFDETQIGSLVKEGKIVFVDITADWCLTCAANEKFVLTSQSGVDLLSAKNVVLMRGDWTSPSPEITAYLRRHGRYGIPFNIVYSPKNPAGFVLPELLTLDALAMALNPMNCLDSKTRAC